MAPFIQKMKMCEYIPSGYKARKLFLKNYKRLRLSIVRALCKPAIDWHEEYRKRGKEPQSLKDMIGGPVSAISKERNSLLRILAVLKPFNLSKLLADFWYADTKAERVLIILNMFELYIPGFQLTSIMDVVGDSVVFSYITDAFAFMAKMFSPLFNITAPELKEVKNEQVCLSNCECILCTQPGDIKIDFDPAEKRVLMRKIQAERELTEVKVDDFMNSTNKESNEYIAMNVITSKRVQTVRSYLALCDTTDETIMKKNLINAVQYADSKLKGEIKPLSEFVPDAPTVEEQAAAENHILFVEGHFDYVRLDELEDFALPNLDKLSQQLGWTRKEPSFQAMDPALQATKKLHFDIRGSMIGTPQGSVCMKSHDETNVAQKCEECKPHIVKRAWNYAQSWFSKPVTKNYNGCMAVHTVDKPTHECEQCFPRENKDLIEDGDSPTDVIRKVSQLVQGPGSGEINGMAGTVISAGVGIVCLIALYFLGDELTTKTKVGTAVGIVGTISALGTFFRNKQFFEKGVKEMYYEAMTFIYAIFGGKYETPDEKSKAGKVQKIIKMRDACDEFARKCTIDYFGFMRQGLLGRMENMAKEARIFFNTFTDKDRSFLNVKNHMERIEETYRSCLEACNVLTGAAAGKQLPVRIWIYGPAGYAKTHFTKRILTMLENKYQCETYRRKVIDEFWSGFYGQTILFYDDMMASKEHRDALEWVLHGHDDSSYTTGAAIADKGKPVNPLFMVTTSTKYGLDSKHASKVVDDNESLIRRRDVVLYPMNPALDAYLQEHKDYPSEAWMAANPSKFYLQKNACEDESQRFKLDAMGNKLEVTEESLVAWCCQLEMNNRMSYRKKLSESRSFPENLLGEECEFDAEVASDSRFASHGFAKKIQKPIDDCQKITFKAGENSRGLVTVPERYADFAAYKLYEKHMPPVRCVQNAMFSMRIVNVMCTLHPVPTDMEAMELIESVATRVHSPSTSNMLALKVGAGSSIKSDQAADPYTGTKVVKKKFWNLCLEGPPGTGKSTLMDMMEATKLDDFTVSQERMEKARIAAEDGYENGNICVFSCNPAEVNDEQKKNTYEMIKRRSIVLDFAFRTRMWGYFPYTAEDTKLPNADMDLMVQVYITIDGIRTEWAFSQIGARLRSLYKEKLFKTITVDTGNVPTMPCPRGVEVILDLTKLSFKETVKAFIAHPLSMQDHVQCTDSANALHVLKSAHMIYKATPKGVEVPGDPDEYVDYVNKLKCICPVDLTTIMKLPNMDIAVIFTKGAPPCAWKICDDEDLVIQNDGTVETKTSKYIPQEQHERLVNVYKRMEFVGGKKSIDLEREIKRANELLQMDEAFSSDLTNAFSMVIDIAITVMVGVGHFTVAKNKSNKIGCVNELAGMFQNIRFRNINPNYPLPADGEIRDTTPDGKTMEGNFQKISNVFNKHGIDVTPQLKSNESKKPTIIEEKQKDKEVKSEKQQTTAEFLASIPLILPAAESNGPVASSDVSSTTSSITYSRSGHYGRESQGPVASSDISGTTSTVSYSRSGHFNQSAESNKSTMTRILESLDTYDQKKDAEAGFIWGKMDPVWTKMAGGNCYSMITLRTPAEQQEARQVFLKATAKGFCTYLAIDNHDQHITDGPHPGLRMALLKIARERNVSYGLVHTPSSDAVSIAIELSTMFTKEEPAEKKPESCIDPRAMELLRSIVATNQFALYPRFEDSNEVPISGKPVCWALAVKENYLVTVKHSKFNCWWVGNMQKGVWKWWKGESVAKSHTHDLALLKIIDKSFPSVPNIMGAITTVGDLISTLSSGSQTLVGVNKTHIGDVDKYIYPVNMYTKISIMDQTAPYKLSSVNHTVMFNSAIGQNGVTEAGDCGVPYIRMDNTVNRKIYGIHAAADTREAECTLLTVEEITELFDQAERGKKSKEANILKTKVLDRRDGWVQNEKPFVHNATGLTVVGEGDFKVNTPFKTKLHKIPLKVPVTEDIQPAILSGNDPRNPNFKLVDKGLSLYNVNYADLPRDEIRRAYQMLAGDIIGILRSQNKHVTVLTLEESINGANRKYFPTSNPVNRKTAVGYPYSIRDKAKSKDDYLFFDEAEQVYRINKQERGEELKKDVDSLLSHAGMGKSRAVVFTCLPKDELVKPKKIVGEKAKTRIFMSAPFPYVLAWRRYFLTALDRMQEIFPLIPVKIGINGKSRDWNGLFNTLVSVGQYGFDVDGVNWDANINPAFTEEIVDFFWNPIFQALDPNWCQKHDTIRKALHGAVEQANVISGRKVFELAGGQQSGQPATAVENSIYGAAMAYIVYRRLAEREGEDKSYLAFKSNVKTAVYGDDFLCTVAARHLRWFNRVTYAEEAKKFGFTFVDAQKSDTMREYDSIYDMTFLKRGFVRKEHTVVGPIDMSSITKALTWMKARESYEVTDKLMKNGVVNWPISNPGVDYLSTLTECMCELSLHGRDVYNKYAAIIYPQLTMLGIELAMSYEQAIDKLDINMSYESLPQQEGEGLPSREFI